MATWTWDGLNWSILQTPHEPPGPILDPPAYDPDCDCLVAIAYPPASTWTFDGSDWKPVPAP